PLVSHSVPVVRKPVSTKKRLTPTHPDRRVNHTAPSIRVPAGPAYKLWQAYTRMAMPRRPSRAATRSGGDSVGDEKSRTKKAGKCRGIDPDRTGIQYGASRRFTSNEWT